MSEHKHGSMETKDQEKTFAGFVRFSTNTVIVCIVLLVLIALING
jgi:fumarate reductase subunit C